MTPEAYIKKELCTKWQPFDAVNAALMSQKSADDLSGLQMSTSKF